MAKLSYSQKQILVNSIKIAVIILIFLIIVIGGLIWSTHSLITGKQWLNPQFITGSVLLLFGFFAGVLELTFLEKLESSLDRIIRSLKNGLKGHRGEQATIQKLQQVLGDQYRVYPNFKIPGRKFDIDMLILGPKGVITLEVKNYGGEYKFSGNDTYQITRYHNGNINYCWLNERENPIKEAQRHNAILGEWLVQNGYRDIKPWGALLMVGDAKIASLEKPAIYVITKLERLRDYIENLPDNGIFKADAYEQLISLLNNNISNS
jgi:hypothetical protein